MNINKSKGNLSANKLAQTASSLAYYLLFIQIHSLHPDLQGVDKLTSIVIFLILRQIMITVL